MADSTGKKAPFGLRLRNLPKPEYRLMKAMVAKWRLDDESELFAVLLRLGYEVSMYQDGDGMQWILNVLECLRSIPEERRIYNIEDIF